MSKEVKILRDTDILKLVSNKGQALEIKARVLKDYLNTETPVSPISDQWLYLSTRWDTSPSFVADITGGSVFSYTLESITRYRFVPNPYDPTLDSFYLNFVNPTLSNLIVSRV